MTYPPFGLFATHAEDATPEDRVRASQLMWHAKHIQQNSGVPVMAMNAQLPGGGSVSANMFGSDHRAKIRGRRPVPPPVPAPQVVEGGPSKAVWYPEGFVFVPRTDEAPNGYGLPVRSDGSLTPGGDFPFVLVNRHRNANYPDYLLRVYADEQSDVHPHWSWTIQYRDYERGEIGAWAVKDGKANFLPQMVGRWMPLLREKRQNQWFCHRPEPKLFRNAAEQTIFDQTNVARAAVGKPPVSPALRGWSIDLAAMVLREAGRAQVLAHDSPNYRIGYQRFHQRSSVIGENVARAENLASSSREDTDWRGAQFGSDAIVAWTNSPGHYSSMIRDYTYGWRDLIASADVHWPGEYIRWGYQWLEFNDIALDNPQFFGELLDVAVAPPTTLTAEQVAPYDDWPPNINQMDEESNPPGAKHQLAAQVFSSTFTTSLMSSRVSWRHPEIGNVYIAGEPCQPMVCFFQRDIFLESHQFIRFKNVIWKITTEGHAILGAGLKVVEPALDTTGRFSEMVVEKQRREAEYNARRVSLGLPSDNSCAGSEDGWVSADLFKDRRLRYVVLEGGGGPPGKWEYQRLVLYEAPGDMIPVSATYGHSSAETPLMWTPTEIASYELQDGTLEFGYAVVNRSGTKFIVAVSEAIEPPSPHTRYHLNGYHGISEEEATDHYRSAGSITNAYAGRTPYGERIRFIEFSDSGAVEIETSEILATGRERTESWSRYEQEINHQCRMMPVFGGSDGDELMWMNLKLTGATRQVVADSRTNIDWDYRMIFPDGTEFPYTQVEGAYASVTGFIRHIIYMNPLYPENTVYIELRYALEQPYPGSAFVSRADRFIMRGVTNPIEVKDISFSKLGYVAPVDSLIPISGIAEGSFYILRSTIHPHRQRPVGEFNMSFWHGGAGGSLPADPTHYKEHWEPSSFPIAPVFIWSHIYLPHGRLIAHRSAPGMVWTASYKAGVINVAEMGEDFIVAGYIDRNIAYHTSIIVDFDEGLPEEQRPFHFYYASFDLKAATGIPDLKDNILPLWSM